MIKKIGGANFHKSLQILKFRYSSKNHFREPVQLLLRISGGAECIANLIARKPCKQLTSPTNVGAQYLFAYPPQPQSLKVLAWCGQKENRVPGRRAEIDAIRRHLGNEGA
jgi:hypothetical protein